MNGRRTHPNHRFKAGNELWKVSCSALIIHKASVIDAIRLQKHPPF